MKFLKFVTRLLTKFVFDQSVACLGLLHKNMTFCGFFGNYIFINVDLVLVCNRFTVANCPKLVTVPACLHMASIWGSIINRTVVAVGMIVTQIMRYATFPVAV